jgi:subtilisin family serine protease
MPSGRVVRQYLAMQPHGALAQRYTAWRANRSQQAYRALHQTAEEQLKAAIAETGLRDEVTSRLVAHPSIGWKLVLEGQPEVAPTQDEHIWSLEFETQNRAESALDHLGKIRSGLQTVSTDMTHATMAADLPVFLADYWSPAEATAPLFGDRAGARRLMGLGQLQTSGSGVNVVVVDQGLDKALVARCGGIFGGGWENLHDPESGGTIQPGTTKGGHGAMMVRNILDVAPGATIFDCPLLPPRIATIRRFLSHADAAYARMLSDIRHLRKLDARWDGPWVFVNAWAIYDRRSEHPLGDYTNNPHHRFNRLISQAVDEKCDVVFCAGNCGQFCPAMRCGTNDKGPGHSILGANSHPSVLTVGAVRVDGLWLGYSSQGPGQPQLDHEKPDLCAASQFAELDDAGKSNTGSSAASALAAGLVAAMRSKWTARALPPSELKQILIDSARKTEGGAWNGRLGHGILDARAAFELASER